MRPVPYCKQLFFKKILKLYISIKPTICLKESKYLDLLNKLHLWIWIHFYAFYNFLIYHSFHNKIIYLYNVEN